MVTAASGGQSMYCSNTDEAVSVVKLEKHKYTHIHDEIQVCRFADKHLLFALRTRRTAA